MSIIHTGMSKKAAHIDKILVPVDLTDTSLCALDAALALSDGKKSQIYLIHVITPPDERFAPGNHASPAEDDPDLRKKYHAMEEFFLKKVRPNSRLACIVRRGVPAAEILRFAREEGMDIIVLPLPAGGEPAGDPVRTGGIAGEILRGASIPVMVVKPGRTARKPAETTNWEMEGGNSMSHEELYLREIRQRVCAKCLDRTPTGLCVTSTFDECAINRYLPEIIDIVLTTGGDDIGPFVARLREKVCSVCVHQSPGGSCNLRDDVECALDRYFPLVVEAINDVKLAR